MPHPTRPPALPRRFFPIREHFETSARALDIVEEVSLDATSPDAAFVAACKEFIEVDDRRSRLLDLSRRSAADERQLAMLDERPSVHFDDKPVRGDQDYLSDRAFAIVMTHDLRPSTAP